MKHLCQSFSRLYLQQDSPFCLAPIGFRFIARDKFFISGLTNVRGEILCFDYGASCPWGYPAQGLCSCTPFFLKNSVTVALKLLYAEAWYATKNLYVGVAGCDFVRLFAAMKKQKMMPWHSLACVEGTPWALAHQTCNQNYVRSLKILAVLIGELLHRPHSQEDVGQKHFVRITQALHLKTLKKIFAVRRCRTSLSCLILPDNQLSTIALLPAGSPMFLLRNPASLLARLSNMDLASDSHRRHPEQSALLVDSSLARCFTAIVYTLHSSCYLYSDPDLYASRFGSMEFPLA